MAQDFNFQDGVVLQSVTIAFDGERISLGTNAGAKSLIFENDSGGLHLNANPTADHSVRLADASGTVALITAISAGTALVSNGALSFSNASGVVWGVNGNTVTGALLAGSQAVGQISAGAQTASVTASFADSNGISWGLSNSSVLTASADFVRSLSAGGVNAVGNQVVLSNSNGLSFGANGSTITAQMPSVSYWDDPGIHIAMGPTIASRTVMYVQRIHVDRQCSMTELDFLAALTVGASDSGSMSFSVGLYTMNRSSANQVSSGSVAITWINGTNSTAASVYGGQSGTRWRSIPLGTWNITPGEYLLGMNWSSSGVLGSGVTCSMYVASTVAYDGDPGQTANTRRYFANGKFSVSTSVLPASFQVSDLLYSGAGGVVVPYVRLIGSF